MGEAICSWIQFPSERRKQSLRNLSVAQAECFAPMGNGVGAQHL
jgi:hypothetical protein